MSHEYRLVFSSDLTAQRIMDSLKASESCVRADQEFLYLKDQNSKTVADYDARLSHDDDSTLWLEVNFKSSALHDLVRAALDNKPCKCLSEGDVNEEVELSEAFQLGHPHIFGP
ncbi:hypothetical protein [Pseudomonas sp. W2-17]|uniref:hypothetical protein n=1 Tax=Pseudomonas sp. W2-17 TaxID=3058039 RepID=UPI0034E0DE6E